jgi:hypothetical protein
MPGAIFSGQDHGHDEKSVAAKLEKIVSGTVLEADRSMPDTGQA